MNIDLTPIFQAIIALLAALVTYKLIPWIKSKTTQEQQKSLLATVNILVFAAEQLYGAGKGPEKLQYVKDKLGERGYDIDIEAIEAAVKDLNLQQAFTSTTGITVYTSGEAEIEDEDEEPKQSGDGADA
jgi:type II secretory pathway pseudopilin PulG